MTIKPAEPTRYLDGPDAEPMRLWYEMVARVLKAASTNFVVYIPPHLEFSAEHYSQYFRPLFVDRLGGWLKPLGVELIDNSVLPGAGLADAVALMGCRPDQCISSGFHLNLAGEFKQARLMIESLINRGLLRARPLPRKDDPRES